MTAPTLYISFPGNAAQALAFYCGVFGGELDLHTFAEMGRSGGPADAIGHGVLSGPVSLYGTDTSAGDESVSMSGISIAPGSHFHAAIATQKPSESARILRVLLGWDTRTRT